MNGRPLVRALPVTVADEPADRLAALFDAHYDRLYRLARRLTPAADDALDLVQDTFLKAARFPASVPRGLTREEAWLVRVLINIRRDEWRKQEVRRRYHRAASPLPEADGADQEAAFIARATVWSALDALPPRRRAVVVMHELEGLTTSAIASVLAVSAVTVRWHLATGRRALARVLTRVRPGATP